MSARILKINGEDYLLSITRNITERIEAEQRMHEAHAQVEKPMKPHFRDGQGHLNYASMRLRIIAAEL
jgi:hypothetical protein